MKNVISQITLLTLSIVFTIAFSSFYFTQKEMKSQANYPDEIGYKSTNKKTIEKEHLVLRSAFQNDYFHQSISDGHFLVELEGLDIIEDRYAHTPLNISIVIDRSGSMSGDKIKNAKKAANYVVDMLSENDIVSVVMYDGEVNVVYPAGFVKNKSDIKNKINGITDRGGTNLTGGMMEGYAQVRMKHRANYINRVLLLSDGLANEGITDPYEIKKIVQGKIRNEQIAISTFGVGNDYNEDLMTAMAEKGAGNYYFISEANNIAGIFQKELQGIMNVVAQNAQLKINIPEGMQIDEVVGYSYTQENNQLSIPLHTIFSKDIKSILVKYSMSPSNSDRDVELKTTLSYESSGNNRTEKLVATNYLKKTSDINTFRQFYNEWVEAQIVLNESNQKLETAMQEIDKGNYEKGKQLVQENKVYMTSKKYLVEKTPVLQQAETTNANYDESIKEVEVMSVSDKKYIQKATKSENYKVRNRK